MGFEGFTKETVRFLGGLRAHNDRDWFEAHRKDYEGAYLGPAMAFAEALAPRLRKIEPDVSVEPRVNGSIMRINRDIRFSKDKSPYKDHLDMWFWAGDRKGWDTSGFWFRLTPDRLMLGAGMHGFDPQALARYRAAVLNDKKGAALAAVVAKLGKAGYEVGGESYKRPPAGVAADHPRAALLRHGGLYAGWEGKHPPALGKPAFIDFVAKHYAAQAPIHRWLRAM